MQSKNRRQAYQGLKVECTHLADIVVFRVETLTEVRQQFRPVSELPFGHDSGHQNTDSRSDQRRGVANAIEAFLFDEVGHLWGKLLKVNAHIVLENQTTQ
jgi:hypothetical protein